MTSSGTEATAQMSGGAARGIDPITYEVLANAFTAVVEDMGAMLEKVAFSTVVSIGKDFVTAIGTPSGDIYARGERGLPMITGTASQRLKAVLDGIPLEEIDDGDVFLFNDPYTGGTHAQDVTCVMPIFDPEGEFISLALSAAHWPDVGGPVAGSFNSEADSCLAEGLVIPPIHYIREGKVDHEVERLILRNVRIQSVIKGDLRGMVEACNIGRERILALQAKYGTELLRNQMEGLIETSERRLREEIGKLPDGTFSFTDHIDRDPGADSDAQVPISLEMTIEGERLIMDWSRSGPQAIGPVNSTRPATEAAMIAGVHAIFHEVEWNQGLENVVELVLGERTVVSAEYPRPVSGVAASPGDKVYACVMGCMVQVVPEKAQACPTNLVNINIYGPDGRPGHEGEEYVMYLWMAGGWGARPGRRDAHTSLYPVATSTNLQPVEFLERVYPIRFHAFEMRPDSEGAGRHRGGFAFESPLEVRHGDATINCQGDRQLHAPWGIEGGERPEKTDMVYALGTPEERRIDVMSSHNQIAPDVKIDFWQSGGGGWGDPFERDPEWVLDDVRQGLVSIERARQAYGVAIEPAHDVLDMSVDQATTAALRAERGGQKE
jgi:N-methylhydantoinase B